MLKVGLTGGIGCGKTTVGKLFADLNVAIIDADEIAHELVRQGQPALLDIRTAFGNDVLNPDGSLNRKQLRDIVFADPERKKKLETIMHPRVFAEMQDMVDQLNDDPYCISIIPLLFETGKVDFVDRVLVVDCPLETQVERVKRRDNLSEALIRSVIGFQVSRDFRVSHADEVIDSTLSSGELAECVKKLHNFYLSISTSPGHRPL